MRGSGQEKGFAGQFLRGNCGVHEAESGFECRVAHRQAQLLELGDEQFGGQDHVRIFNDGSQAGGFTALENDLNGGAGVQDHSHRRWSSRRRRAGLQGLEQRPAAGLRVRVHL